MNSVGLVWQETDDFLPQQHFLVFKKPEFYQENPLLNN